MAATTLDAYNEIDNHDEIISKLNAQLARSANHTTFVGSAPANALPYNPNSKKQVAIALVDLCTSYIELMWPQQQCSLPLRMFVFEILRRSRIQYPVFQVAMCYLTRCRPYIQKYQAEHEGQYPPRFACGRRILVAALQVASKFLQDRFYSASVWSRVSGLNLKMLQENELALMQALEWRMYVSSENYMEICRRLRASLGGFSPPTTKQTPPPRPLPIPLPLSGVLTPESSPNGLKPVGFPLPASTSAHGHTKCVNSPETPVMGVKIGKLPRMEATKLPRNLVSLLQTPQDSSLDFSEVSER